MNHTSNIILKSKHDLKESTYLQQSNLLKLRNKFSYFRSQRLNFLSFNQFSTDHQSIQNKLIAICKKVAWISSLQRQTRFKRVRDSRGTYGRPWLSIPTTAKNEEESSPSKDVCKEEQRVNIRLVDVDRLSPTCISGARKCNQGGPVSWCTMHAALETCACRTILSMLFDVDREITTSPSQLL